MLVESATDRTRQHSLEELDGKISNEKEFLRKFVEVRKKQLLKNSRHNFKRAEDLGGKAILARAEGDDRTALKLEEEAQRKETNARFLENSANKSRCPELTRQVASKNWDLKGDFKVNGKTHSRLIL